MQLLAGDIGGTKTILRLDSYEMGRATPLFEQTYRSADFEHLTPMVQQFLQEAGQDTPQAACFAIAGPVKGKCSKLSNLSWELDASQMETALNIPIIRLINDFAAVGYGILDLEAEDTQVLNAQPTVEKAPIAVLGAGTGLGEALLCWGDCQYSVLPSEGGHTDFAPRNEDEIGLLRYLLQEHHRISVERVVSGMGLRSIYAYLRDSGFGPESPTIQQQMKQEDMGAVITSAALSNSDSLCSKTVDMFVAAYGAEAGNLALKTLAYGGVYIAGGIAAKILPKMTDGQFMQNFVDKGRMRPLLESMKVSVITNPQVGLIGAALYARRLVKT